jgi:hypothetical protein
MSTSTGQLDAQLSSLGRQMGRGSRFRPSRTQIVLVALAVLGFWLVLVFGRALTELNETTARQQLIASETEALSERLEAARRELALVQTDSFQALQARSFGMGERGEVEFSIQGERSITPIVPLGGSVASSVELTPLDAWLLLLFGG